MKTGTRQRLEQTQNLRLSPMQVRLGRMLEMSGPEAHEEVMRELDANPALEMAQTDSESTTGSSDFGESAEELQRADYRDDDAPEPPARGLGRGLRGFDADDYQQQAAEASLEDNLLAQLSHMELALEELQALKYVIGNLDSNGWLTRTSLQMAQDMSVAAGREVPVEQIRQAMARLRQLDPPGIGAVDLRDCLLRQLDRMKTRTPTPASLANARTMVADYFDLLASRRKDKIMEATRMTADDYDGALELIRTLNPRPGASLCDTPLEAKAAEVVPDFHVAANPDGTLTVTLLNTVPELCISRTFTQDGACENAYARRRVSDAAEFMEMLRRRSNTLLLVMQAIAARQKQFFLTEDTADLHPMLLKDIAGDTGLGISAVSRATSGKWVATETGIYPLKLLFNSLATGTATARQIMSLLKEIVDNEDPTHPLDDEQLRQALAARGHGLARRTVAKYRDAHGIPPARTRRKS